MLQVAEIQNEILSLAEADHLRLRKWFFDLDWQNWDGQIEADSKAGKLNHLIAEAIDAKRRGVLSNL